MNITLQGKRALVTGSSSGIGEGIAYALAASGAKVIVNGHSHPEKAQTIVDKIKQTGGEAIAIQADVATLADVEKLFQQIDKAWGSIDILINNAGVDGDHMISWESDPQAWQKVIEINLFGAYYCAREALKRMVPQKSGVVINMTSVHEEIAWSGYSAYCASKAGLSMMSKTLAQEAAPYNVRVLSVAPGAIKTPINKSVWSDPESMKDLLTKIPLNRIGEVDDIANAIVFLSSDAASYITGRTFFVDGGMTDYPDFAHGG